MLGNQKNKEKNSVTPQGMVNLIGAGTVIKGDIICEGDIRIDGQITGNVKVGQRLVVGESGVINGSVIAQFGVIAGNVNGNMQVQQSALLQGKSSVKGDIYTAQIIIESGAKFNGRCVMDTQGNASPAVDE